MSVRGATLVDPVLQIVTDLVHAVLQVYAHQKNKLAGAYVNCA